MLKARIKYFALIVAIIALGLLSREFTAIPAWIGDVLWATMVFFMVRFLAITAPIKLVTIISLAFCYAIEISQLYKAPWIDSIRHTLFGRLVLGDTFLWGDLLSYTVGIGVGIVIEAMLNKNRPLKS